MADANLNQFTQRPDYSHQKIDYVETPDYYIHPAYDDKLAILVCQIKIWKPSGTNWFDVPNKCLTIRECESIEITDSSKELINKAVIRFPRGTVISQSSKPGENVETGNPEDNTQSNRPLVDATNGGEFYTKDASRYSGGDKEGVSITSIAPNYDDKGLIEFNRTENEPALLSPNDIAIGNRIEIRLGYAYSDTEFEKMNNTDNHPDLVIAFTGFITSMSVDTPLEIECTNMAHVLSCVSAPDVVLKNSALIKDFLDEGSEFNLLEGTGIELANECKGQDISVSGGKLNSNLTVADVLNSWKDAGIMCMLKTQSDGSVKLHVGYVYYAGKGGSSLPNNDKKYISYNGGSKKVIILQSDWDIAEDHLTVKENDKKFLAIEAHARVKDGNTFKFYKLTVRKNPNSDDEGWMVDNGDGEFQTVNKTEVKDRKRAKNEEGNRSTKTVDRKMKNKVDLKRYTVIPYFSTKIDITEDELIEEAKQYWGKCAPNGISGKLIIFGDLEVRPTDTIGLIDMRQPEKNGYYLVESVNTTFGVNGYRRELTIPFKIASFKGDVKVI